MATNKDNTDLPFWLIGGGLFTLTLIGFDVWYSSYDSMEGFLKGIIIALQAVVAIGWVVEMINFNDPNFDWLRKGIVWCSIIAILLVGLHHATHREDKQVLIDSKENAEKQRIEDSVYKAHLPQPKDTVK